MIQRRPSPSGFTLVEVLVAVLVFGLVAAITYGGLNALTSTSGEHQARADDFAALQRAVAALDRDLRQLTSRPVRQAGNAISPALTGDSSTLLGTRAGWVNPARQQRSQLQRFGWQLENNRLVRRYWSVTDAVPGSAPLINLQIDQVQALNLRYRDEVGQWHSRWPIDGRLDRLPSAIEYRLLSERFGEIRRLLLL